MRNILPCPRCRRLLHTTPDGRYPRHREPPPRSTYHNASVPLTGADAPWCPGGGTKVYR